MKKFTLETKEILKLLRNGEIEKLDQLLIYKFLEEQSFSIILKNYEYDKIFYNINYNNFICDGRTYFRIDNRKHCQYLVKYAKPFIKQESNKKHTTLYNHIDNDYNKFCILNFKDDDNYLNYTKHMFNTVNDLFTINNYKYNVKYLDMHCKINNCKGFNYVQNKKGSLYIIDHNNQILSLILPVKAK